MRPAGSYLPRLSFWLYAIGLVQLAITGVALLGIAQLDAPPAQALVDTQARLVAAVLPGVWGDPVEVAAVVARAAEAAEGTVVVRDLGGAPVASSNPLPDHPFALRGVASITVAHGTVGRVEMVTAMPPPPLRVLFGAVAAILGIAGLGALAAARFIVRPIEQLTHASKAFGDGALRVRSGIVRGDEVGALARAFDAMASRIESLVLAQSELLANVSHELRTPLARMQVALDLLHEGAAPDRALLAELSTDLAELQGLVSDTLTAARLDLARGKPEQALRLLATESFTVGELVRDAVQRFRSRHPARELREEIVAPASEAVVTASRAITRRAVENLLDNAARYSPTAAPITLRVELDVGFVTLQIEDHGIGMSEEEAARAFEPFFRSEPARLADASGLGLGLTLARRVAEVHGGTLSLSTHVSRGTTATLRLPV